MVQQNYGLWFCSLMTINTSSPSKKYSYVYEFPKSTFRESPILFSVTDYSIIKRTQNKFQNLFTVGSKEKRKEESRPNAENVSRRTKCSLLIIFICPQLTSIYSIRHINNYFLILVNAIQESDRIKAPP